jgi:hypothetical protein
MVEYLRRQSDEIMLQLALGGRFRRTPSGIILPPTRADQIGYFRGPRKLRPGFAAFGEFNSVRSGVHR